MLKSFETERLLLKILNKEAASMVLSFYEEGKEQFEAWEPKRSPNFYTLSYQRAFLSAEYNQMADGKLLRYWIFCKDNPNEIIGTVCFQNLLKEPYHSCSIGYKLASSHQHQGYAMESIRKCIEVVFQELHIHRIDAYIMPENVASLHLVQRLNFLCEGTCISFARINGVWTDHMHYALVNPED